MKRVWIVLLALAVFWTMAPHWQNTTTAWAYSPVQSNGMRLAVRLVPAPAGQAPTASATGTAHFVQIAMTPVTSDTTGAAMTVDGYNLYRSATSGAEIGTSAINGTTLIPNTIVTAGCPAGISPCVLYTDNAPLAAGWYKYDAQKGTNQSAISTGEAGPPSTVIPINPQQPGAATAANKQ